MKACPTQAANLALVKRARRPTALGVFPMRESEHSLIAGALFIALEMALLQLFGKGNIWDPVRLSASITLGNRAVPTSTPFTFDIFFVGMMIHSWKAGRN
jgi:hypothetical protein